MFIPDSRVWKFHLKIRLWKDKSCLPRAYGSWEASFSSRGLIFGGEEISIPETRPIWKSYIFVKHSVTSESFLPHYFSFYLIFFLRKNPAQEIMHE
jgi:hypothetical protein